MRVNRSALAQTLGVAKPTIDAWVDDGMPYVTPGAQGAPWVFDTVDCIEWWAENKHRRRAHTPAPSIDGLESYEQAERRKMVAAADKAELELAKAAGKVVMIEDVTSVIAEMHTRIRTRLLGIGNQVRMQVRAFLGDDRAAEEEVVGKVETIVADALAEIRDDPFEDEEREAGVSDQAAD